MSWLDLFRQSIIFYIKKWIAGNWGKLQIWKIKRNPIKEREITNPRLLSRFIYLCRKTSIAYSAFERSFLRMTPVMYLQRGLACERLVAEFTSGVATYCNRSLPLYVFESVLHSLCVSRCKYLYSSMFLLERCPAFGFFFFSNMISNMCL